MSKKEREERLRRSVDELAMKLVTGQRSEWDAPAAEASTDNSVAAALRRIGEQARKAGLSDVASIAAGLAGDAATAGDAYVSARLGEGIQRLQAALAAEEAAPPPEAAPAAQPAPPLFQDSELVADFIIESREHLANIESRLLTLERNAGDMDALHSVFRGFHTIKGLAGFLDLAAIQEVAHELETVLDVARNRQLSISAGVIDIVLAGADFLKVAIDDIEASKQSGTLPSPADSSRLIARVRTLLGGSSSDGKPDEGISPHPPAEAPTPPPSSEPGRSAGQVPEGEPKRSEARREIHAVRVATGKLDHLVDMVGELVIAQSLIRHDQGLSQVQSARLQRNLAQLTRITGDVQRTAMAMRMVPVEGLFHRMARLVRDLSRKKGKQVELSVRGEDTELDRNVVEELADPLMHMIRNSLDHGIETPDERQAAGKPSAGNIELAAFHESGSIVIELSDDGSGLHRDKILRRARERGLIADGSELSQSEIHQLIFEPGFSTASEITDVSGRGVGMDVVRRNITKLRGRVDVESVEGEGSTFSLRVPLTLAIIEGLIVGVGPERFIAPIHTVREMLRPTQDALSTLRNQQEMVMVRGRLLPVVRLHRRFRIRPRSEDPTESLLLVAETLGRSYCLMVDDLIGKQEVVIKSLGEVLKNTPGVAGGAILGDGHVGLILDMDGIFQLESGHA